MVKAKASSKKATKSSGRDRYDFSLKNPNAVITRDEEANFDECMRRKNKSLPANKMPFKKAVQSVDMERLFP
jgi:hypothetical protein